MQKVVEKGNIKEERIYLGDYEIFRKFVGSSIDTERETVHISDDNQKIAQIDGETIRYQLSDHLGSASLELDEKAEIISYEEYYPFGTTSYRSGRSETEVSQKRYKYVMKELDNETGLYYYGMRFYASWICRFISVDPLQHEYLYYTPYQYAGNMPITFIDLDGKGPWDIAKGASLIVGGLIQWFGGVVSASTPTGVGQIGGAALIMNGSMNIGWGFAVLVNNGEKDIPTGSGQAIGRGIDQAIDNGGSTFETAGVITDFAVGLPSGGAKGKTIELASYITTSISAISTVETVIEINIQENKSRASNNVAENKSRASNNVAPNITSNNKTNTTNIDKNITQNDKMNFIFNKYKKQLKQSLKAVSDQTSRY